MVVHVGLGCDVFSCLVISVEIVVRFTIAIEHQYVSNEFCCRISSGQGNIFACRRGLDHDAFGVCSPVHQSSLDPYHERAGGLASFVLSCEIDVSLTYDVHGRSVIFVFLRMFFVVFMYYAICDVVS